jgi:hypothetical protein
MEQAYLTLWKRYLAEQNQGDDAAADQGIKLVEWARKYAKMHKLELQSRKSRPTLDDRSKSEISETWSYGEGWKAKFPQTLTHQVEIAIVIDENAPQNNKVFARVYGTGIKASVGDMVDSTIYAADWDASKQTTIESLLKPYVRG